MAGGTTEASDRANEASGSGAGEADAKKEVYQPLDPKQLVQGIEGISSGVFGFFQNTFTIPFQHLPKWIDDREALKTHIFKLDGDLKGLKQQLVLAEQALEATKAERSRSAAETMRHWRTHRREVEKLREDQAELLAGLQELRTQAEAKEVEFAAELRKARAEAAAAKRDAVELRVQLAEAAAAAAAAGEHVAALSAQVTALGAVPVGPPPPGRGPAAGGAPSTT